MSVWRRLPLPAEHLVGMGVGLVIQRLRPIPTPRWLAPAGRLMAVAGVALAAAAIRERGAGDVDRPVQLVTGGVHSRTRNPMYLAWSLLHVGVALSGRAGWVALGWPVALWLIQRTVLAEEAELQRRFGAEYTAYRSAVPRYLPTFRHRGGGG